MKTAYAMVFEALGNNSMVQYDIKFEIFNIHKAKKLYRHRSQWIRNGIEKKTRTPALRKNHSNIKWIKRKNDRQAPINNTKPMLGIQTGYHWGGKTRVKQSPIRKCSIIFLYPALIQSCGQFFVPPSGRSEKRLVSLPALVKIEIWFIWSSSRTPLLPSMLTTKTQMCP